MFNTDQDVLIDEKDLARLKNHFKNDLDELEVMSFQDCRGRRVDHSGIQVHQAPYVQKTSSLLFTFAKKNKLSRYSAVTSGWKTPPFDRHEFKKSLLNMKWEPKKIQFHRSKNLPTIAQKTIFYDWYNDIQSKSDRVTAAIKKKFKGYNYNLQYVFHFDRCFLLNTYEHQGSFEHPYTRLEYTFYHQKKKRHDSGLFMNFGDPVDVCRQIDEQHRMPFFQSAQDLAVIKKGQIPAIIAPSLVMTLGQILFEQSKSSQVWPMDYSRVIPQNLVLRDHPSLGVGQNSIPFDHEGTLTYDKVIVSDRENLVKIADLQMAHLKKTPPTGNGFRRGMFVSHLADLTPVIQSNYLRMDPGRTSIFDILKQHKDFLYLHHVSFPFDRFQQIVSGKGIVVIEGTYFKAGKPSARLIIRNNSDRPLISAYPRSYGSLLDSSSIILSEGLDTYTGWFPYLFLPKMTLGNHD